MKIIKYLFAYFFIMTNHKYFIHNCSSIFLSTNTKAFQSIKLEHNNIYMYTYKTNNFIEVLKKEINTKNIFSRVSSLTTSIRFAKFSIYFLEIFQEIGFSFSQCDLDISTHFSPRFNPIFKIFMPFI